MFAWQAGSVSSSGVAPPWGSPLTDTAAPAGSLPTRAEIRRGAAAKRIRSGGRSGSIDASAARQSSPALTAIGPFASAATTIFPGPATRAPTPETDSSRFGGSVSTITVRSEGVTQSARPTGPRSDERPCSTGFRAPPSGSKPPQTGAVQTIAANSAAPTAT